MRSGADVIVMDAVAGPRRTRGGLNAVGRKGPAYIIKDRYDAISSENGWRWRDTPHEAAIAFVELFLPTHSKRFAARARRNAEHTLRCWIDHANRSRPVDDQDRRPQAGDDLFLHALGGCNGRPESPAL